MGDKAGARKSYQNFLTLWKDADPDIPIYQQAKADMQSCSSCNPADILEPRRRAKRSMALDELGSWTLLQVAQRSRRRERIRW